uniref:FBA_2 domain-containing protein n=1 Tax=Caenorhabditis tropicalis TaxID=1561998 RepID=A0A1I7TWU0_9PELO
MGIFKLPALPMLEVMKSLSLYEIIKLSMCSERTGRWLGSIRPYRRALTVNISFTAYASIALTDNLELEHFHFQSNSSSRSKKSLYKKKDSKVRVNKKHSAFNLVNIAETHPSYYFYFNFKDELEGLLKITGHLCSLFGIKINEATVSSASNPNAPAIVMEWMLKYQKGFRDFKIQCGKTSDTVTKYLLDNVHYGKTVFFHVNLTPEFKTDFKFDGEELELRQSCWVTRDNLLSINCSRLYVCGSKFSDTDINAFLKHWMTNDLKFKEVWIEMDETYLCVLFSGIPVIQHDTGFERIYDRPNKLPVHMKGGIDIERYDGVTATIIRNSDTRRLLRMFVWNNENNGNLVFD